MPTTTNAPPPNMAKMTLWITGWKRSTRARAVQLVQQSVDLHQSGVVLMGMEWGNKYALPSHVRDTLSMFHNEGINTYLGLWVNPLTQEEADTAERAFAMGGGWWDGIIFDAEAGWVRLNRSDPERATAHFNAFMERMKKLHVPLAYAPYGVPHFHRSYNYSLWNSAMDVCFPQVYISRHRESAQYVIDRSEQSFARESVSWSRPAVPNIPVLNIWGRNADPVQVREFARLALEKNGAVSWWRLHARMRQDVKDVLRSIPRDTGTVTPPPIVEPPIIIDDPFKEPWTMPRSPVPPLVIGNSSTGSGIAILAGLAIIVGAALVGLYATKRSGKGTPVLDVLRSHNEHSA